MTSRTTAKQARILAFVASNPGATAADIHRAIGGDYAHGHHKFTYESVSRLRRQRRLVCAPSASGRGTGLTVA